MSAIQRLKPKMPTQTVGVYLYLLKAVRTLNMRLTILANAKRGTQRPILSYAVRAVVLKRYRLVMTKG